MKRGPVKPGFLYARVWLAALGDRFGWLRLNPMRNAQANAKHSRLKEP